MPIYKNDKIVQSVYRGSQSVDKVYRGSSLVYGASQYQDVYGESPCYEQYVPAGAKHNALLNMVSGQSIKWNVINKNNPRIITFHGIEIQYENGILKASGTCTSSFNADLDSVKVIAGHKYLLYDKDKIYPVNNTNSRAMVQLHGANVISFATIESGNLNKVIGTATNSGTATFRHRFEEGYTYDFTSTPMLFDLTDMFGYGNEPNDPNLPKAKWLIDYADSHPQIDVTYIVHSNVTTITSKGKNLCNLSERENITWASTDIDMLNIIKNLPKGKYMMSADFEIVEITRTPSVQFNNMGMGIHKNGRYLISTPIVTLDIGVKTRLRFSFEIAENDVIDNFIWYGIGNNTQGTIGISKVTNIQIEEGTNNTDYVPYHEPISYQIPFIERDFYGINDIYNERNFKLGKRIMRIGKIDLGDLNWTKHTYSPNYSFGFYGTFPSSMNPQKVNGLLYLCADYATNYDSYRVLQDKEICGSGGAGTSVWLRDDSFSDVISLREHLKGKYLYYELRNYIEEPINQEPIKIMVSADGKVIFNNEPIIDIYNEVVYQVPLDELEARITSLYNADIKEINNL